MRKFKVWECKILVPVEAQLPLGFDSPPRKAAIRAIEDAGIEVECCWSGWGGKITRTEQADLDDQLLGGKDDTHRNNK